MSAVRHGGSGAPMEFRLDRATYNVMISRTAERKSAYDREKIAASRAAILSDRLRRYSKSLFEEALDVATHASSTKSWRRSLPVISTGHVMPPKDFRLRPTTAGPNGGGTATNQNNERIRMIIGESNTKYRVIPSPGVRPTSGDVTCYRQYVLVPKDCDTEKTPSANDNEECQSELSVAPPINNHQDDRTNSQCSENDVPEQDRSHDVSETNDDVTRGQDGEAKEESDRTAMNEAPERKEDDGAPCKNGVDTGQPTGGASSSLTSSSIRARYRRVTWVDELTVSTPSVAKPEVDGDGDEGAVAAGPPENGGPEVQKIINLNDLRANCWSLPGFVCPRSEEKSREARMMDWIQTTNFNIARRTLPLL